MTLRKQSDSCRDSRRWSSWPKISIDNITSAATFMFIIALCSHHDIVFSEAADTVRDFYLQSFNGSSLTFLRDSFEFDEKVYLTSKQIPIDETNSGTLIVPLSHGIGKVLYHRPIRGRHPGTEAPTSFSTTFIFEILNPHQLQIGDGLAFVMGPNSSTVGSGGGYLGVLDARNLGIVAHTFAVEFDTWQNPNLQDPDGNHVGIDVNNMISERTSPAGFWDKDDHFKHVSLTGYQLQAWIDYDSKTHNIEVSISPLVGSKPGRPLISLPFDLTSVMEDTMYVGFAAATGDLSAEHVVHAWSFNTSGPARNFQFSTSNSLRKLVMRALCLGGAGVLAVLIGLTLWSLHQARKRGSRVHVGDLEAPASPPAANLEVSRSAIDTADIFKISADLNMHAFTEPR